jgi:N-sulfoglucosamine sulfohydrolase
VRRADDGVGEVLAALKEAGHDDDTLVMFLSDHGMPLPFSKTQLYHHSTHTPLTIRWPGVTQAGAIDDQHMVSAVDFLPTLLDVAGIAHPAGLDGRSFAPLVRGERQSGRDDPGRDYVVKEYNENSGGSRDPMRAIQTRQYLYIFNAWSNGQRIMQTATTGTPTYRRMRELAATDPKIAERHKLYQFRVVEELYDVEHDPDCLHNLLADPAHAKDREALQQDLEAWMVKTRDPMLEVFRKRHDAAFREAYVAAQEREADQRRATGGKAKGGKGKGKKSKAAAKSDCE